MSVFEVPDYDNIPPTLCLFDITSNDLRHLLVFRRGKAGKPKLFRTPRFQHLAGSEFPTHTTNIYLNYVANISKAKLYVNLHDMINEQATYLTYLTKELFLTTHGKIYDMGDVKQVASDGLIHRCSESKVRGKLQQHFLNLSRNPRAPEWDDTDAHIFTPSTFGAGKCDICMIVVFINQHRCTDFNSKLCVCCY